MTSNLDLRSVDDLLAEARQKILRRSLPNTRIEYVYCDAAGYKAFGSAVLLRTVALSDVEDHFIDGEFFIPEHVGLRSLAPLVKTEDDHMLHRIISLDRCFENVDSVTPAEVFIGLMKWNKANNALWP